MRVNEKKKIAVRIIAAAIILFALVFAYVMINVPRAVKTIPDNPVSLSLSKTSKTEKLLLLGDSVASGYGLEEELSYGKRLSEALGDKIKYTNLASTGAATDQLKKTIEKKDTREEIAAADTIIVSIGGNDLLTPALDLMRELLSMPQDTTHEDISAVFNSNSDAISTVESMISNPLFQMQINAKVDSFSENFRSTIEQIKEINPEAYLCVQTIYNPLDGVEGLDTFSELAENTIKEMNAVIFEEAEKWNFSVADVFTVFSGNSVEYTKIQNFDIHPNQQGHDAIFKCVYKSVTGKEFQ